MAVQPDSGSSCDFPWFLASSTGGYLSISIFQSAVEASEFFQRGSRGYSPAKASHTFDGLELRTCDWYVEPFAIDRVESSFFANRNVFREGSVTFDCALLMRGVRHEWHAREFLAA